MRRIFLAGTALALGSCNQASQQQASEKIEQPARATANAPSPATPPPKTGPDAGTSLAEPQGPIDPKSVEAAGQVVQSYGALIEQKRWNEAGKLWGDSAAAAKFAVGLEQAVEAHLEIGNPGDPEGAAGSVFVTMPVIFYGDAKDRQPFRRSAEVILRRVNDVPGSTEAQRRWHIERIDWAG